MTPGRGVSCRAMEGMTRFVVASAAAARWRPALPALLPLLLAVPALRGSPAAGKGTKGARGAGRAAAGVPDRGCAVSRGDRVGGRCRGQLSPRAGVR